MTTNERYIEHTFVVFTDASLYAGEATIEDSLHQAVCDYTCFQGRSFRLKLKTLLEWNRARRWLRDNTAGCCW